MFETKYHKPTVGSSRRLTKQFAKGGYVDPDIQTDAEMVDEQMASNRLDQSGSDRSKDSEIAFKGGDRGRLSSPERAIDSISAQARIKNTKSDREKDGKTYVRRGKSD